MSKDTVITQVGELSLVHTHTDGHTNTDTGKTTHKRHQVYLCWIDGEAELPSTQRIQISEAASLTMAKKQASSRLEFLTR